MMSNMRSIAGRRVAAAIALGVLAVCAFLASRLLAAKGLVFATNVATIISAVFAVATPTVLLLGKLFGLLSGSPPVSKITLEQACAGFVDALKKQWAREDELRQVYDPWPLPVRWRLADGQTERFGDIRATFTHTRRLVILGPAGAGKSVLAIKLVRDLLAAWEPGDPVPVLLPAASWTRDCTMTEWITEQLARSQPALDVRISTGTGEKTWLPRELAESGLIPVIDGLDELPRDRWTTVVTQINAFGSDYPLVLTSRLEEYHAAIAARGISRAVVIELEPLEAPEIKGYLTEATDAPVDRWRRVFERLAETDGVLDRTLATPLMIWLARNVYKDGASEPAELLDPVLFPDRAAIESHLVAEFVPAVYAARQTKSRPGSFRCSPQQATRWLGFLARRLNRTQEQEIAWWQLFLDGRGLLIISRAVRAVLYTCIFWWVSVWALTRRGYWRHGAYIGHGRYQDLLLAGPLGKAVRPLTNAGIRWLAYHLSDKSSGRHPGASYVRHVSISEVRQLSADVDSVLRVVAQFGLFRFACLAAACGILAGVVSMFRRSTPTPRNLRFTRRKFLRKLFSPLPWLIVLAFLVWDAHAHHQTLVAVLRTQAGWSALLWLSLDLISRIARSLKTPIEVSAATDPAGLLRADRRTYLADIAAGVPGVATTWLWSGGVIAIADGMGVALGIVVALLLGGVSGAWACYVDGRLRLAVLGRLPLRTISFLDDAHRRGVLRQTGGVYQFRHIRLQQQLAAGYSPWPRPLRPVATWTGRQLARLRNFYPLLVPESSSTAPGVGADATEYTATLEGGAIWPAQAVVLLLQTVIMVALFPIAAFVLPTWIAVPVVIVDLLLIPTVVIAYDKVKAATLLPSENGSVHVTPDAVEITQGPRRIRLTADDVERIAVRPFSSCWLCYAVQAKLRPGVVGSAQETGKWVPVFWTPRYTASIPRGLVSALAAFADGRLDRSLETWLRRQAVVGYEESGTVEVKSMFATLGPRLAGLLVALSLTGIFLLARWSDLTLLAVMADLALAGICGYQLRMRTIKKRLPQGPWAIHLDADTIEITRSGRTARLSPADIESIEFRPIRGKSSFTAIYARLRPGVAARLHITDGWYPLYWPSSFRTPIFPSKLLIALAVCASGRLTGSLRRRTESALAAKAPVDRG